MADTNAIIEENEQNVGEYDPNPYDNITVEEALKQLFNRFTPRTVRQAIFTMAENNKPATLIEKSIAENGEYTASNDDADGYSKVTVDVTGSSKTTINLHFGYDETLEKETVTIDVPYETAVNAILSGSYEFIITDENTDEGEQQPACAGAWLYYDIPEDPYVIVATLDWSSSGRSYWFHNTPEASGVCIMPYPGGV